MIINPFREKPDRFGNTRLVTADLGLAGKKVRDPRTSRVFVLSHIFGPVNSLAIQGIRVRGQDKNGIVSFINQRDLEVLLGLGVPGRTCRWFGRDYVDPSEPEWIGFAMEPEDSQDDLLIQEMQLVETKGPPKQGDQLIRDLHCSETKDIREEWLYFNSFKYWLPEQVNLRWQLVGSERLDF